jgi:16S rRNA (guanine527-N7)-methyltransferase
VNNGIGVYKEIISTNGLPLQEDQFAKLEHYAELLSEWNAKVNLVSRKDEESIWPNHILHSISILFEIRFPEDIKIADIGSGGGLPGIPLSIVMPRVEIVLIDSIRKKSLALEDMIQRLGVTNARVVNARAEDVSRMKEFRHSFDLVLARAVAPLERLIRWSAPLVRKEQKLELKIRKAESGNRTLALPALVAMKGGNLEPEISEARKAVRLRDLLNIPILFDGIENTTLVDKHIVIVAL